MLENHAEVIEILFNYLTKRGEANLTVSDFLEFQKRLSSNNPQEVLSAVFDFYDTRKRNCVSSSDLMEVHDHPTLKKILQFDLNIIFKWLFDFYLASKNESPTIGRGLFFQIFQGHNLLKYKQPDVARFFCGVNMFN